MVHTISDLFSLLLQQFIVVVFLILENHEGNTRYDCGGVYRYALQHNCDRQTSPAPCCEPSGLGSNLAVLFVVLLLCNVSESPGCKRQESEGKMKCRKSRGMGGEVNCKFPYLK